MSGHCPVCHQSLDQSPVLATRIVGGWDESSETFGVEFQDLLDAYADDIERVRYVCSELIETGHHAAGDEQTTDDYALVASADQLRSAFNTYRAQRLLEAVETGDDEEARAIREYCPAL